MALGVALVGYRFDSALKERDMDTRSDVTPFQG